MLSCLKPGRVDARRSESAVPKLLREGRTLEVKTERDAAQLTLEVKLRVSAAGDLRLRVGESNEVTQTFSFPIFELLGHGIERSLTSDEGMLTIRRKAGDELRIVPQHESLVFSESQVFQGIASFNFGAQSPRRLRPQLKWSLKTERDNQEVLNGTIPFQIPRRLSSSILQQPFALNVPNQSGAYHLAMQLVTENGQILAESIIPFVVHSGRPQKSPESSQGPVSPLPQRRIGMALHRPETLLDSLEENSQKDQEGTSRRDWTTFLKFTKRLGDEAERGNCRAVVLGARVAEGALYPTDSVAADSTLFDNGQFAISSPDPFKKDVLELVFREFDRRGLILIPELDLSGIDPILEQQIAELGEGGNGIRSQKANSSEDSPPEYQPLAEQVQRRVLELHREIIRRYGHHRSFGGISLAIHDQSWCSLPVTDPDRPLITRVRFQQNANSGGIEPIRTTADPKSHKAESEQNSEAEWLATRCRQLTQLYHRLADLLADSRPEAKLYLSPHRMIQGERFQREVLNLLHSGRTLDAVLTQRGIEPRILEGHERVVLLRPYGAEELSRSGEIPVAIHGINSSPSLNHSLFPWRGTIQVGIPRSQTGDQALQKISQAEASGGARNQFLAHSLTGMDAVTVIFDHRIPDLPGEENATSLLELQELIRNLPAIEFATIPHTSQPVTIRMAKTDGKTWIYAANESPLAAQVTLKLTVGAGARFFPLSKSSVIPTETAENLNTWTWELPAMSARGCAIDSEQSEITVVNTTLVDEVLKSLQARVDQLESSLSQTDLRPNVNKLLLPNSDFESEPAETSLPTGWNYAFPRGVPPHLDSLQLHGGKYSLRLSKGTKDDSVQLTSFPISLNGAKHATLSFWARSEFPEAALAVTFRGMAGGRPWTHEEEVHANRTWQQFVLRFTDFPGELTAAHFTVSLNQPGKIWLDDFELYPQRLTPEDEKRLMRSVATIRLAWQEQRYADCVRLMDGYWGRFLNELPRVTVNGERSLPQVGVRYRELIVR